jgi:hypothetical protein
LEPWSPDIARYRGRVGSADSSFTALQTQYDQHPAEGLYGEHPYADRRTRPFGWTGHNGKRLSYDHSPSARSIFVALAEQAKLDRTISRLIPLRDSFAAEVIIVIISYANVATIIEAHLTAVQDWRWAISVGAIICLLRVVLRTHEPTDLSISRRYQSLEMVPLDMFSLSSLTT